VGQEKTQKVGKGSYIKQFFIEKFFSHWNHSWPWIWSTLGSNFWLGKKRPHKLYPRITEPNGLVQFRPWSPGSSGATLALGWLTKVFKALVLPWVGWPQRVWTPEPGLGAQRQRDWNSEKPTGP